MTSARRDWKCRLVAAKVATIALLATAACAAPVGTGGEDEGSNDTPPPPVGSGSGSNEVTGLGSGTGGASSTGGATGSGGSASGGSSGSGGEAGGTAGSGGSGGEPPVTTPGLEASYSFEDSGTTIADDSGHSHNGQLVGSGVSLSKGGKLGNALSFSGGNGHARIPGTSSLDFTSAATIEFWVKLSSVSSGTIVSRISPSGDGVRVRSSQGNLQVTFTRASGGSVVATSDAGVLGSSWTHVAIVNNGVELKIYLDGKLHRTDQGGKLGFVASDLFIGAGGSADTSINGYVDELAWWSIALTAEEVCTDAGGTWASGDCT